MKKQYPSDELVDILFNLLIDHGLPDNYNFPEYEDFIASVVKPPSGPDDYDKYEKCRIFKRISKNIENIY